MAKVISYLRYQSYLDYLGKYFEFCVYIVFFLILLIQGYFRAIYHGELIWGDDFQWISWLYRIGQGEIPYRDFFTLYGPILPFVFYVPFRIMGGGFLDWNLISYVGLPLICFIIAVLISRILFKSIIFRIVLLIVMSIFPPYGFFLLQPWFFRFFLSLFTFVILFSKLRKRFLLAGVWIGVILFSSVDQGFYLLGSLGAVGFLYFTKMIIATKSLKLPLGFRLFKFKEDRRIWEFGKGLGIVTFLIGIFLTLTGALKNYVAFSFIRLPSWEMAIGGIAFPDLPIDKLNQGLSVFLLSTELRFYLPILIFFLSLLWLVKEYFFKKDIYWPIVLLTIYGVFSFRTTMARSDIEHLSIAFTAVVILAIFYCERAFLALPNLIFLKDEAGRAIRAFRVILALLFIVGTLGFFFGIRSEKTQGFLAILKPQELRIQKPPETMAYSSYVGVYVNKNQASDLSGLMDFIKQNGQDGFYGHGWFTGLYFLMKTKNPTYFDYDDWASDGEQVQLIKDLETYGVSYVIGTNYSLILRGSRLKDYLTVHYKQKQTFGDLIVFERDTKTYDEGFWQKRLVNNFQKGWNRLELVKENPTDRVYLSENGLKATGRLDFIFESTAAAKSVSKVQIAVKPLYTPILSMFAKTFAQLSFLDKDRKWQNVSSDTRFLPKFDPSGQLVFHIYPPQVVRKMRLIFSAPGGFNPVPWDVNIIETWMYQ